MVYVRLEQEWIDGAGASHVAGDMIDVDAGTLAELESRGIVAGPDESGAGVTSPEKWAGPGSPGRG